MESVVSMEDVLKRLKDLENRVRELEGEKEQGYVYFILNEKGDRVKIGFSRDPQKRMRQLQTANAQRLTLLATIPGTKEDEKYLHARYRNYRGINEWFRMAGPLRDYVEWAIASME